MVADKNIMQFPVKSPYDPESAKFFDGFEQPDHGPVWLNNTRRQALEYVKEYGIPSPKLEHWKYTNLPRALAGMNIKPLNLDIQVSSDRPYAQSLVDMAQRHEQWLAPMMMATPQLWDKMGPKFLWNINTAFLRFGIVIDIPDGRIVEEPIRFNSRSENGQFAVPRIVVRLGRGAQATIIEDHAGEGEYWRNTVVQILLDEGAQLNHYRNLHESAEGVSTRTVHLQQKRDSRYNNLNLTMGGKLDRCYMHAELQEQGAECAVNKINLLEGARHSDTTYLIEHQAPHCNSHQFVRSVLGDESRGVFQGKVYVHQEAQKTDGYQLANTILLSEKAEMNTKPELEIYADDVKCSHGATTGMLDDEPIFYLRSRGLTEAQARALMLQSFIGEVADKIEDETFKSIIDEKVETWLQKVL
jgi:Fe-S cluster assembly protein SufD